MIYLNVHSSSEVGAQAHLTCVTETLRMIPIQNNKTTKNTYDTYPPVLEGDTRANPTVSHKPCVWIPTQNNKRKKK